MTFEKIREIICEQLGLDEDEVTMESDLVKDLECDSLDVVEMTIAIQDEYGLQDIPEEELVKLQTVGDLVKYVDENK